MNKPFTPFLTSSSPVPATAQPFQAAIAHGDHGAAVPSITLKRDGDRINQIIVRCTCGQVSELTCQY